MTHYDHTEAAERLTAVSPPMTMPFTFTQASERCWSCDAAKATTRIGLCSPCKVRLTSTETPPESSVLDAEPGSGVLQPQ